MDRREFLQGLVLLFSLAGSRSARADTQSEASPVAAAEPVSIQEEPWSTLAAVQSHLFPVDGEGPGAEDFHATAYLRRALDASAMNPRNRQFILEGVGWLQELAEQRNSAGFIALDETGREDILRQIAGSEAGERWLSLLLLYTIEALLSDPIYGGNAGETGWRWLEHQPGFPRPSDDQRYEKLLDQRG